MVFGVIWGWNEGLSRLQKHCFSVVQTCSDTRDVKALFRGASQPFAGVPFVLRGSFPRFFRKALLFVTQSDWSWAIRVRAPAICQSKWCTKILKSLSEKLVPLEKLVNPKVSRLLKSMIYMQSGCSQYTCILYVYVLVYFKSSLRESCRILWYPSQHDARVIGSSISSPSLWPDGCTSQLSQQRLPAQSWRPWAMWKHILLGLGDDGDVMVPVAWLLGQEPELFQHLARKMFADLQEVGDQCYQNTRSVVQT